MKDSKKGITYKVGYKTLKNMIAEDLDKVHQFPTKKARKEAIKCAMKETREAFDKSVSAQLQKSIGAGVKKYGLVKSDMDKKEALKTQEQKA